MAAAPNPRASISMTLLDEVKRRADITQIVSDYVDLDTSSRIPKARCPFHAERTPSFVVYPESGTWHCFGGCSTGGDAITFLMKQENYSFGDALRRLAERYGIDTRQHDTFADRGRSKRNNTFIEANGVAARYFTSLLAGPEGADARQYLESRGITADVSTRRGLGLAPSGMETLGGHLKARGISSAAAVGSGLITRRREGEWGDMFRGRITIEIHDSQGRIVGFGARSLDGSEPKYLEYAGHRVIRQVQNALRSRLGGRRNQKVRPGSGGRRLHGRHNGARERLQERGRVHGHGGHLAPATGVEQTTGQPAAGRGGKHHSVSRQRRGRAGGDPAGLGRGVAVRCWARPGERQERCGGKRGGLRGREGP